MANVLSLALRVTADASGLKLDPVQRALVGLGDQADKLTKQFEKFTGGSDAAAKAQANFDKQAQDLINTLRDGGSATEFAAGFERLTEAVNKEAAAFERAAQITAANLSPLERFDRAQAELNEQVNAGRISLETYNRATESAAKGLTDAERAARGLAVQQKEIDNAAQNTTLKFNELSGVFSVLPGPLGNIAGRISGISSASEGLSRVFAGGLKTGLTSIASSVTALINPFTLALAGIAAFAAGAAAVARGLLDLEDRVEKLGNTADKLGVSFEFIQTLEEAANRSGTSIDAVSAAFGRLQKSVLGVDEESKAAQKALSEIGVTADELAALSPEEQYQRIGQALADIEDPARRTATATALFGRAGADLIPFFNNIGPAADDIERYGRALTSLDRQRIDEFGNSLDALRIGTQGLGQSLLLPFVGLGDGIARGLGELTAGITAIVDPIGRILEPLFTQIGRVVENLGVLLGGLGRIIGAVFEPFAVVVQEVFANLEPLFELFQDLFRSLVDGAVAVAEWVISFTPTGAVAENVGALGEVVSRVVNIIVTAFQRAGEFVSALFSRFSELVAQSPFLQTLGEIIGTVFGSVASVFSTIADAVGGFVGRLLTIAENFLGIDQSAQQAADATGQIGAAVERSAEEVKALDKAFADSQEGLDSAIAKAGEFGQAGFDAALEFQAALADLQEQANEGELNAEQYARGVANATAEYEKQIDLARQVAEENERLAEEAQQRAEAEDAAVQQIIDKNLEQMRVDEQFGGDSSRAQAADNLLKIQQEIVRVEEQLQAARSSGDQAAIDAATSRLATLDQVAARERDVASGAAKERERAAQEAEKAANKAIEDAKRLAEEVERVNEQIQNKQEELATRQFEIEVARAEELATVRTGSVEINDLRSGGISAFFDTLKEDPAIAEAKKQTKELEAMRKEIAKLNAEKVDILSGAG
jgi:phage-related protein